MLLENDHGSVREHNSVARLFVTQTNLTFVIENHFYGIRLTKLEC